MDPDVTPKAPKTKASLKSLLAPLKNISAVFKNLLTPLKNISAVFKNLLTPLKNISAIFKNLLTPLKNISGVFKSLPAALKGLPIPKKLVIPALAGVVLLIAGGAAFGLLHARSKHAAAPGAKAVASAPGSSAAGVPGTGPSATGPSTTGSSATGPSATGSSGACSGVVRDIYRQTVAEDPSVSLAEVRSEVLSSGVSCAPVPEIAAKLKDLSPACRDMVQYTFLGVREGHTDITVTDVRDKVVEKSVACEHDRSSLASVTQHKAK